MAQSGAPPPEAMRRGMGVGKVLVLVLVFAIIGGAAGYYFGARSVGPAGPGKLVVGTNTPFPPFEFRNATTDEIEGFDIDLITEALDRMGYGPGEWELFDFRDFTALLAAVGNGNVDIAVSAITMNGAIGTQRNATMDFTNPYYESDQGVLKRTADGTAYCADTANCLASELDGLDVAVQAGTSSEFWVADNLPTAAVQTFPDVTQVLQALQTNQVDIVVIDRPAADGIVAQNPNQFAAAGTIQTNELFAFAVTNNDPLNLVPGMNSALSAMESDGTYDQILNDWF